MLPLPLLLLGLLPSPAVRLSLAPARRPAAAAATMQFDFGKMAQGAASTAFDAVTGKNDMGLSKEEQEGMEDRLKTGDMSFEDFLKQVKMMQKAGSIAAMMKQGPFAGGGASDATLAEGQKKMERYGSYVELMSEEERANPSLLIDEAKAVRSGSMAPDRLQKLADAAGCGIEDVGAFVTEFASLRVAASRFARGDDPNTIRKAMEEEQQAAGNRAPPNRAMRRAAKKKKKAPAAGAGGFGARR